MNKIAVFILIISSLFSKNIFAQGADCTTASPFCTAAGTATFPASQNTTAPVGPDYDCLGSQPNPAWYYLQVATSGTITLDMSNSANVDIDFIIWGPFASSAAACSSGLTGNVVDCSYSGAANETGIIPGAIVGEVYVLLITNYSNQATNISLTQSTSSTGATNCGIVCSITSLTATPGACVSPTNLYDLTGMVSFVAPPATGTLVISNSCTSTTEVINGPFSPGSLNYTLTNLPANGLGCTVTAKFSSDPTCTMTQNFLAPPACYVNCPIIVDSVNTCDGVPATLTASGATSGYIWSTGETTASIVVSGVPGTYTVIGATGACADTAISMVTTFPPPTVAFTGDTLTGCNTLTVDFIADTVGNAGAVYNWKFGEPGEVGTGYSTSHDYTVHGCHTVQLTASFGPGCATTDSISCMVNVYAPPLPGFILAPSEIDVIDPTAYFTNTSTSSVQWLWNFGDSTYSIDQHPEHTYSDVGTYLATLYASTLNGCIDSISLPVVIKDIVTKYVPNTFSPNKNGLNDVFNIQAYGISPDNFELSIFDRWGRTIFKTNDINVGWNGSMNNVGELVPVDTYVYHINYKEVTGKKKSMYGHISLLK
ncbi:MAG: gliding motility-associated C-terminal domain-containing protein [Bacteroidota bacterium]